MEKGEYNIQFTRLAPGSPSFSVTQVSPSGVKSAIEWGTEKDVGPFVELQRPSNREKTQADLDKERFEKHQYVLGDNFQTLSKEYPTLPKFWLIEFLEDIQHEGTTISSLDVIPYEFEANCFLVFGRLANGTLWSWYCKLPAPPNRYRCAMIGPKNFPVRYLPIMQDQLPPGRTIIGFKENTNITKYRVLNVIVKGTKEIFGFHWKPQDEDGGESLTYIGEDMKDFVYV